MPARGRRDGRRILLVGYYGVDNLGDEVIRSAIERAASLLGAEVARYVSRGPDPDPRVVRSGLRALPSLARAIRSVDRVVLGGGGILKDEGKRLPLELLATVLLARLLRRRVTLIAVGVGPFYTRPGRWMAYLVARLCSVRTVRDEASRDALASLGIGRVIVGADPVFTTDSLPSGSRVGAADHDEDATPTAGGPGGPTVLVSVRPWFHKVRPVELGLRRAAALDAAVGGALSTLASGGWQIRFAALYWPRDLDASAAVAAASTLTGHVVLPARQSWAELVRAADDAALVIAMRYHAVVAAALAGRPVVALAYEPKVLSLAQDLGVTVLGVDGEDVGPSLAAIASAAVDGSLPEPAGEDAVDQLRQRAWLAVRAALLD